MNIIREELERIVSTNDRDDAVIEIEKYIINHEIELLKWAIQFVDNPKDRVTIDDKISEIEKEIK